MPKNAGMAGRLNITIWFKWPPRLKMGAFYFLSLIITLDGIQPLYAKDATVIGGYGDGERRKTRKVESPPPPRKSAPVAKPLDTSWLLPEFKPSFGISLGAGFPDMVPIAGYFSLHQWIKFKAFVAPTVPFKIHVDMPAENSKVKPSGGTSSFYVQTPAKRITFDAKYGPQFGFEGYYFPFGGTFFIGAGYSWRSLEISGITSTSVTALTETGVTVFQTNSEAVLDATVETSQRVLRGFTGWQWSFANGVFMGLSLGLTLPSKTKSSADIDTRLSVGDIERDDQINNLITDIRLKKNAELEAQVLKSIKPIEKQLLPLLLFEFGFTL